MARKHRAAQSDTLMDCTDGNRYPAATGTINLVPIPPERNELLDKA